MASDLGVDSNKVSAICGIADGDMRIKGGGGIDFKVAGNQKVIGCGDVVCV